MFTIMRIVVVLPEPFGTINPEIEPWGTVSERSSTAITLPKVLVTCEICTASIRSNGNRWTRNRAAIVPRAWSLVLVFQMADALFVGSGDVFEALNGAVEDLAVLGQGADAFAVLLGESLEGFDVAGG